MFDLGKKVLREPGSNLPKIHQKLKVQETIGIDSGGPEEPFDALVGSFRAIFEDFDQKNPRGTDAVIPL